MHRSAICGIALVWIGVAGCRHQNDSAAPPQASTLRIGYGLDGGGVQPVVQILTQEGLLSVTAEGRSIPRLAESWTVSDDGLDWSLKLRSGVTFHDGTPLSAELVRRLLQRQLPDVLGPAFQNVRSIEARSPNDLTIRLSRRSTFLPEALAANLPIHPRDPNSGTGPFAVVRQENNSAELRANQQYHEGRPFIDRILIEPYASVRAAWADMLRGQLDMVYEIGVDAFDSVKPATETKVFTYRRPYSYVVLFNLRTPAIQSPALRRALNAAIDRDKLVEQTLAGHARPARGPIWPDHWTYDPGLPSFEYRPQVVGSGNHRPTFTCLYSEPSDEKVALFVQQQLQAVGVDMRLEFASVPDAMARAGAGNFEAWLAQMNLAPSFFRQSLFWHSQSSYNWSRYHSAAVDAALDSMDQARTDGEYKAGAAAFQRAMIDDPPGIFLAWSDRLRAVSSKFNVHVEPGRDILLTLRSWRPALDSRAGNQN